MCFEWDWKTCQDVGLSEINPWARGCFQNDDPLRHRSLECAPLECGKGIHQYAKGGQLHLNVKKIHPKGMSGYVWRIP